MRSSFLSEGSPAPQYETYNVMPLTEQEEGYESEESHAGRDEQDLTQSSMHLR